MRDDDDEMSQFPKCPTSKNGITQEWHGMPLWRIQTGNIRWRASPAQGQGVCVKRKMRPLFPPFPLPDVCFLLLETLPFPPLPGASQPPVVCV